MSPFVTAVLAELSRSGSQNSCPLCRSKLVVQSVVPGDWRRPSAVESFTLAWCAKCKYGELVERPTPETVGAFYAVEDYYTHHQADAATTTAETVTAVDKLRIALAWRCDHGLAAELNAADLQRYGASTDAEVCDVGCGNGALLSRLATAGYRVVGVDPDAEALRTARSRGHVVHAGSAEQRPEALRDCRFDVVTMMHVLEHCIEPLKAVENAVSLVREGGLVVIETPNNECRGARRAGNTWRWLDVPRHLNFFTADSLRAICRAAGLEIATTEFTGYTRQFKNDWIAEECEIARRLSGENSPAADLNSAKRRALGLLAATWNAAPEKKYDSVRVVARRS